MSIMHPSDDDAAFDAANTNAGLYLRVRWVKRLRAALLPFAEGRETQSDRDEAAKVLDETKEWL